MSLENTFRQLDIRNEQQPATSPLLLPPIEEDSLSADFREGSYPSKWKDITRFLDDCCEDLSVGELVHLESFTLYDAMAAIEIMDPKMDTGMLLESDRVSTVFDPLRPLSGPQVIGIMARLLANETAWLSGHGLAQTLFTCWYLHHIHDLVPESAGPDASLVCLVLKAYLLGTLKSCELQLVEMTSGNVYEEEDFITNTFGLSFCEEYSTDDAVDLLCSAEVWLSNVLRSGKPTHAGGHPLETPHIESLLSFIRFRKYYLLAIISISQPHCSQYPQAGQWLQRARQMLDGTATEIDYNMGERHTSVRSATKLATAVDEAFDPLMIRKLASQAPPRPISRMTVEEALDILSGMLVRLEIIAGMDMNPKIESLQNFLSLFATMTPRPCPFTRSKLSSTVCSDLRILGHLPISLIIRSSIMEFSQPPEWVFDRKNPVSGYVEHFLAKSSSPFVDLLKASCHNRSRQRRLLSKLVLDWELVQHEAETLDAKLRPLMRSDVCHFSFWAYRHKVKIMIDILLLGLELELYGCHEYGMIFWYLNYLCNISRHNLDRVAQALLPSLLTAQKHLQNNVTEEGSTGGIIQKVPMAQPLHAIRLQAAVQHDICRGTYLAISALQKSNHMRAARVMHDIPETRYANRLRVFRFLASPALLSYEEFEKGQEYSKAPVTAMFEAAIENFEYAKKSLDALMHLTLLERNADMIPDEHIKDLNAVYKVSSYNITSLKLILRDCKPAEPSAEIIIPSEQSASSPTTKKKKKKKQSSSLPGSPENTNNVASGTQPHKSVECDFTYHRCFPVFRINSQDK